jgi:hypothetical protein
VARLRAELDAAEDLGTDAPSDADTSVS